jgi:hypothetical protein
MPLLGRRCHCEFVTSAAEHSLCAVGVYTHNLQPSPPQQADLMDALKVFGDLGYVAAGNQLVRIGIREESQRQ